MNKMIIATEHGLYETQIENNDANAILCTKILEHALLKKICCSSVDHCECDMEKIRRFRNRIKKLQESNSIYDVYKINKNNILKIFPDKETAILNLYYINHEDFFPKFYFTKNT